MLKSNFCHQLIKSISHVNIYSNNKLKLIQRATNTIQYNSSTLKNNLHNHSLTCINPQFICSSFLRPSSSFSSSSSINSSSSKKHVQSPTPSSASPSSSSISSSSIHLTTKPSSSSSWTPSDESRLSSLEIESASLGPSLAELTAASREKAKADLKSHGLIMLGLVIIGTIGVHISARIYAKYTGNETPDIFINPFKPPKTLINNTNNQNNNDKITTNSNEEKIEKPLTHVEKMKLQWKLEAQERKKKRDQEKELLEAAEASNQKSKISATNAQK